MCTRYSGTFDSPLLVCFKLPSALGDWVIDIVYVRPAEISIFQLQNNI